MSENNKSDTKKRSSWYWIAAWALWGAVIGYIGSDLFRGDANGKSLLDLVSVSQIAALAVAILLLICMAIVAIGFAFPKVGIAMKIFEDIEEWQDERIKMWNSVIGGGAWAIMMIVLAFAEELSLVGSVPALVVMALAVCLVGYTSWRILGEYDELGHGVNLDTYTYAMYLTLAIGGAWSVAAQLEFLPALGPLDWITLLTFVICAGAIWAAQRRGLLDD